jgi:hypothetical protein
MEKKNLPWRYFKSIEEGVWREFVLTNKKERNVENKSTTMKINEINRFINFVKIQIKKEILLKARSDLVGMCVCV